MAPRLRPRGVPGSTMRLATDINNTTAQRKAPAPLPQPQQHEVPSTTAADSMEESFSFACGGWLKMYLFGVAKALQEVGADRDARMIGCSAGALAATALALRCDFDLIRGYVLNEVVPRAHGSLSGPFQVRQYLTDTLRNCGDLDRFNELNTAAKKLTVVYSSLSAWASRRVTSFDSADHLEKSLLASCCAVPIAGMPFKLKGEWVMDGGVLDFQPVYDSKTITVSPFYCTNADIKPSRYVPMWWAMYPPTHRDVEWLFDLGYEDGLNWAVKNGKAPRGKALQVPTRAAAYDGQWTTTVGRVVGYRGVESRVLDILFVALFVCLWKPLAFALLYMELYVHALVSGGKAALFGAAAKLMVSSIVLLAAITALATHSFQETLLFVVGLLFTGVVLGVLVLLSGGLHEAASVASKDWKKCRACLRNITSLSLFLRSVPVFGSSIEIKRHEYLLEHSLVYRLALHFV